MKKVIYVDLDGTAAEWRSAASLSDLYQKGYFATLRPTEVASFINKLVKNDEAEFFTLSAYILDSPAYEDKNWWIDKHMPNIDKQHRIFVPTGVNKAAFVMEAFRRPLTENDILVDDYSVNLIEWQKAGGKAIKWLNGINGINGTFKGPRVMWLPDLHEAIFC